MAYIYEELNGSEIAQRLLEDDNAGWTTDGAWALAEHLENFAEETETPIQLDIVAIRCEYSEYEDFQAFRESYSDVENMEELEELTTVITFGCDGAFIIQDLL
jgi:hypothetical protein